MSEQRAVPRLTRDERMRAEGAMNALDVAGERIAALTVERDSAKRELAEIEADAEAERKKYEALKKENAALKQQLADEELTFNHANEVIGKLQADVARMSAPVSDAEWVFYGGVNFSDQHKKSLSRIIAARTTPPAKEPKQ